MSTEYARFSLATNSATSRSGASDGNVLTSGAPPTCRRIWRRVCGASLLLPPPKLAVGFGIDAGASAIGCPDACASRSAFSRAAFSARSRLSASICALIAARARWSSSFSVGQLGTKALQLDGNMEVRAGKSSRLTGLLITAHVRTKNAKVVALLCEGEKCQNPDSPCRLRSASRCASFTCMSSRALPMS